MAVEHSADRRRPRRVELVGADLVDAREHLLDEHGDRGGAQVSVEADQRVAGRLEPKVGGQATEHVLFVGVEGRAQGRVAHPLGLGEVEGRAGEQAAEVGDHANRRQHGDHVQGRVEPGADGGQQLGGWRGAALKHQRGAHPGVDLAARPAHDRPSSLGTLSSSSASSSRVSPR